MSEQVLLNAVRASLDLPMSFTKLQRYTAGPMTSGSFAPKIPFGADAAVVNDLGPTVNWNPGVFQIEYADVNTAGALTKLNQSVAYTDIDRYISEGLPPLLVLTMFAKNVNIHSDLATMVVAQARRECRVPKKEIEATCNELYENFRECTPWYQGQSGMLEQNQRYISVRNNGHSKCDFLNFQSFILTLRLSGFASDLVEEQSFEILKTPEERRLAVPKIKFGQGARFQSQIVHDKYKKIEADLKRLKIKRAPLAFSWRSPRAVLSYLGELIALRNYSNEQFTPQILIRVGGEFQKVILFRVVQGIPGADHAALAVTDEHRRVYYVPQPAYGSQGREQTLRVLAVAAEVVNAAISEKDFPAPTSVVVRAIQ